LRVQLQRAEELARQGQLEDYEANFGRNRFDLTLKGSDRVIEVKYWTKSFAEKNFDSLAKQLLDQQATGKEVILNMYQTKGDSITWEYWTKLLEKLAAQGVNLSEESSLLCLVE
jgi:ADP-heptose:LPS heptosyltransferase